MEVKRTILVIFAVAASMLLVGCSSSGGDDYDPKKIAVKQPGNGPPPINQPTGESKKAPK